MGFWSWLTGGGREKGQRTSQYSALPELVLLTKEPLVVEASFIQGAIEHALGVTLPLGEKDATEFVTGTWPIFFFQFGGRLMQIKLAGHPYSAPVSRPFVSGDPDDLLRKAQAGGLGDVAAAHQAWIAVTYMNPPAPAGEDPYRHVAKMLGAFAIVDVLAVVDPARGLIVEWDEDMLETLEAGEYKSIFGR
jgi:hypothetical protein